MIGLAYHTQRDDLGIDLRWTTSDREPGKNYGTKLSLDGNQELIPFSKGFNNHGDDTGLNYSDDIDGNFDQY